MPPVPADPGPMTRREAEVRRFVRQRFGLRGTLRLHRAALGCDLLRAPVNVALSPVFLILKLVAALLGWCGARRAAAWNRDRRRPVQRHKPFRCGRLFQWGRAARNVLPH